MSIPKSIQDAVEKATGGKASPESVLDHILPPNPPAPSRPTIPPPTCGTLPPLPSLPGLLGGLKW